MAPEDPLKYQPRAPFSCTLVLAVDLLSSLGPQPSSEVQRSPSMAPSFRVFVVLAQESSMRAAFTRESALEIAPNRPAPLPR